MLISHINRLENNPEILALEAWAKVQSVITGMGSYENSFLDDIKIHQIIVNMGGWPIMLGLLYKDMPTRSYEFVKRYLDYCY